MRTVLSSIVALAFAGSLLGCNDYPGSENGETEYRPAPLPASTGGELTYPPGPYGVQKGSTISDYTFPGFPNAKLTNEALETIQLSDFYNPHAGDASYEPADPSEDDRLFPPGSPYGEGTKKPTAVLISIASVWCGPCNQEAKSVLPGLYAKYQPCGGEILFQLIEGPAAGTPATESNLRAWTKKYKVDYPATIDPAQQLSALYSGGSFPAAVIVDTRTMTIVETVSGVPTESFWSAFESTMGDPACMGAHSEL